MRWRKGDSGLRAFEVSFSELDLNINRSGKLTNGQRKMLQTSIEASARAVLVLRTGLGLCGSLCVCLAVLFQNPSLLWVGGGLLTVYTGITLTFFHHWNNLKSDLAENMIAIVGGEAAYQHRFLNKGLVLVVGGIDLGTANWAIQRMFKEHDHWHVYYLPRSKAVLSAEPLI
jgi:hypothetical protein